MTPLVLTTDELRVVAQLTQTPAVTPDPGWAADDLPVADVVATRSLLARGLLTLAPEPAVAAGLRALLPPAAGAVTIRRDTPSGALRATLTNALLAQEQTPDLWHLTPADAPTVLTTLTAGAAPDPAAAQPIRIPAAVLAAAEKLASRAPGPAVAAHLTAAGLADDDARTLARVLTTRTSTTTVRSTYRSGTALARTTLTWLDTGTESWLAFPAPQTADDAADSLPLPDELPQILLLTPTHRAALVAALTDLLADLEGGRP